MIKFATKRAQKALIMSSMKTTLSIGLVMVLLSSTLIGQKKNGAGDAEMARKIARFAPTPLTADTAKLSAQDRKALSKIIAAAKLLDPLFLRQVWGGNDALEKVFQPGNVLLEVIFLADDLQSSFAHGTGELFVLKNAFQSTRESGAIHPWYKKSVNAVAEPIANAACIESDDR